MSKNKNVCKIIFCALTLGITIGYILAKLMERLDFHVACIGSADGPTDIYVGRNRNCCHDECSCGEEEEGTETSDENENGENVTMKYDEP